MNFQKILLGVSSVAMFSVMVTSATHAQQVASDKGISVSPVKFELQGDPGAVLEGEIKFYNFTDTEKTIYLRTRNFEANGESATPTIINQDDLPFNLSLRQWIELDKTELGLTPVTPENAIPTIAKFKITIPNDAAPGGYYAAVLQSFEKPGASTEDQPEVGGAVVKPESAALLLVTVNGDTTKVGVIEDFFAVDPYRVEEKPSISLFGNAIFEYPPVKFMARVRNAGNVHFRPLGNIFLYKGDKQQASIQVNKGEGAVLRDSIRKFEMETWGDQTFIYRVPKTDATNNPIKDTKGNTKTKTKINWGNLPRIPIGKYKAKLVLLYDDNGIKQKMESTTYFWVIPWKIIGVVVVLVGGGIGYQVYKNKSSKKSTKRATKTE